MLQKNALVKARTAIESTYEDVCTITNAVKVLRENHSTGFDDVVVCEDEPCRLSIIDSPATSGDNIAANVSQTIKLFMSPDIDVKAGSLLRVSHCDVIRMYKHSGLPAIYPTHQEIKLDLCEEKA